MPEDSFDSEELPAGGEVWECSVGEAYGFWHRDVSSDECGELPDGVDGSIAVELVWDGDVWRVVLMKPVRDVGGISVVEKEECASFGQAVSHVESWLDSEG